MTILRLRRQSWFHTEHTAGSYGSSSCGLAILLSTALKAFNLLAGSWNQLLARRILKQTVLPCCTPMPQWRISSIHRGSRSRSILSHRRLGPSISAHSHRRDCVTESASNAQSGLGLAANEGPNIGYDSESKSWGATSCPSRVLSLSDSPGRA
jgi:hypothetical protein